MGTDMIMDVYMINAKVNIIKQYSKYWIVKLVGDYRLYTKLFLNFLWVTLFYAELLKIFKIKKLVKSKNVNVINTEAKKKKQNKTKPNWSVLEKTWESVPYLKSSK